MRYRQLYPVISAMALAGCGSSPTTESCGDQRSIDKVYHGTLQPSHVPLSPGQILAIGDLMWCSSTLIAPQWVLTAQHCGMRAGDAFCMGYDPADARNCIDIIRVVDHPTADMTLLELATDARIILPEVSPIAIMTEPLNNRWLQVMAEAAGYGQTDQGSLGTRYFTAEPIVAIDAEFMTIDGQNQRGVCFGDSGGPVMVIAGDGTVRVAGALSNGDESCIGLDNFTRTDALVAWIESYTGPTVAEPGVCGGIDEVGACQGGTAMWCDNATLRSETCGPDTRCGWDAGASGFRCITGEDSCGGYDGRGSCNGNSAFWCEDGQLRQRDCSACGEVCTPLAASVGGAYCMSATGS